MPIQKTHLTYAVIALTVASFLTAYFVKPHAPTQDIVALDYDGKPPAFEAMPLANRVAKSYNLALILTRSAFTPSNATALEALRNWTSKKFAQDANFLHPASLEDEPESNQSVIESYTHSLAASLRFAFEDLVANFLSWRIQDFQNSDSYNSFLVDYYGLFGSDLQAQELLAKYESARARDAIDPILIAIVWTLSIGGVLFYLIRRRSLPLSQRILTVLSTAWLALAFYYTISAWVQNQVSILVSAIICGAIGLFLKKPLRATYDEARGLTFRLINLSSPVIMLIAWISISLLFIRVISWIKTGSLVHPDPITLILSGLRGDFLHDPVHAKRNIDRIVGLLWLVFTFWILPHLSGEWTAEAAQEEPLRAIQKPLY
jgi:hypothetical protein